MSIVEKAAKRLRNESESSSADRQAARGAPIAKGDSRRAKTMIERSVAGDEPFEPADHRPVHRESVTLDWSALRRSGVVAPKSMASQLNREFQRIKRPILAAQRVEEAGEHVNRLMVTSAHPGDGKTFTSMNLAISLAREVDYSVVLVDGDVAKPGITRSLGLQRMPGLTDLLKSSNASAEDFVLDTDMETLSILPAGGLSEDAPERLASRRMEQVISELAAEPSRIVIFDSPPLLATAEAQSMALHMGQILLVVRAGRTDRRALESALSLVETGSANISLVLNQSRKGFGQDYDGYYGVYAAEADRSA